MTIRIFRDEDAKSIFVSHGTVGTWPFNCLKAFGNGDGTIDVQNIAKVDPDGNDFFELGVIPFADYVDESDVAYGGTEAATVNALNALFSATGTATNSIPVITSSLAIALVAGNTLNYELLADFGVAFEWDSLPSGVLTVEGNVRKIIGGSGLTAGTYNLSATAVNYYGFDTETVVLTVSSPAFSDTYSINFVNLDYMSAAASTANPLYRASNGAGSGDAWSMSFWLKAGSSNNNKQTIMSFGGDNTSTEGRVWAFYNGQSTNDHMSLQIGTDSDYILLETPDGSITPGVWEHWLITYDGGTTGSDSGSVGDYYSRFAIYKNAVAQSLTTSNGNDGWDSSILDEVFYVGRKAGAAQYMRNGCRVDELALWDEELSAANATTLYNSGSAHDLSLMSPAPDHWWRMGDDDTYPLIEDNVGSLDFTMNNMTVADIVTDVP